MSKPENKRNEAKSPQEILNEATRLIQAAYRTSLEGKQEIAETHLSRGMNKFSEYLAASDPDHIELIHGMPVLKSSPYEREPTLLGIDGNTGRIQIVKPERYTDHPPHVEEHDDLHGQKTRYLTYHDGNRRFLIDESGNLQVIFRGKWQTVTKNLYLEFRKAIAETNDPEVQKFWQEHAE